jgi:hypothetical protein
MSDIPAWIRDVNLHNAAFDPALPNDNPMEHDFFAHYSPHMFGSERFPEYLGRQERAWRRQHSSVVRFGNVPRVPRSA